MTASLKRPAFKEMDQCCLSTGFDREEKPIYLDIAPTMRKVVHKGHTYHRAEGIWGWDEESGKTHAVYLRSDYGQRLMVQSGIKTLEEAGCEPPPVRTAENAEGQA